jgi:Family of unknown function (DUF6284)
MRSIDDPSPRDLRAIEAEWPLIEAELAVVDAEIAAARASDGMTELDRRRMRRSQSARTRAMVEASRRSPDFGDAA